MRRFTGFAAPRSSGYLAFREKSLTSGTCRLRRIQRANIQGNQRVALLLIVFTLQIANDRQRIFFSNIQTLAQIIDFFTFITSNNAITER